MEYCDKRKPEAGTMSYSYRMWLQEFLIVHSTCIDSTATPGIWTVYIHNSNNKVHPTGRIRTQYVWIWSHNYPIEWAIGAGHVFKGIQLNIYAIW